MSKAGDTITIERVCSAGLCAQCGTCAALCPREAIIATWSVHEGYGMRIDGSRCNRCGTCVTVCPGPGLDFTPGAWWRADNAGASSQDFLGPWRSLHIGWASDEKTREAGASGGIATAILQGALACDLIDAAIVCRIAPEQPLRVEPVIASNAGEVAACRGSKYNMVAINTLLRRAMDEPGRYALVGLPCHLQGLRLACERVPRLRERIVFAMGIFCGWSCTPRATEVEALRAGLDPRRLERLSYRGPGWPGTLHLESSATVRELPLADYARRLWRVNVPVRCRLCPDALAELADVSVGDAWLPRYDGCPGVSDLVVRTARGAAVIDAIGSEWLTLVESTPDEIIESQRETYVLKRDLYRGRMWLRRLSRRRAPSNPGVRLRPSPGDRWKAVRSLAGEAHRVVEDVRYPHRGKSARTSPATPPSTRGLRRR